MLGNALRGMKHGRGADLPLIGRGAFFGRTVFKYYAHLLVVLVRHVREHSSKHPLSVPGLIVLSGASHPPTQTGRNVQMLPEVLFSAGEW